MYRYNNERRHGGINYLTPYQKLLKLELEDLKGRETSTDSRTVDEILTINSNHFVTEVVG